MSGIDWKRMNTINFTKEGVGDNVLFLHGWGADKESFRCISDRLMRSFCTVRIDFPGFGQSPPPPYEGWGVEEYADNLAAFMRLRGLEGASVVAHSFGGRVAIVLCAKYPELVGKLVLVDSGGMRRFSLKRSLSVFSFKTAKCLVGFGLKSPECLKKYGSADFKALGAGMRNTFKKVVKQDLSRYAKKIRCPTLIVWGDRDGETPMWMAKKLKRLISCSGLAVLENAGHFSFADDPITFTAAVRYFLEEG